MTNDASLRRTDDDTRDAPDPEDPRKPDSPKDLQKRSWRYIALKSAREFSSDQCTDIAAALTYFGVLSLFPALIAVFALLGLLGQRGEATDAILGIVSAVAPGDSADALRGPIEELAGSPAKGFALVSGILLAIWSASGYVGAFSRAMNRIYEIPEGRPFWKLKPVQLLVTVIAIVLVVIAAVLLVVSGPVAEAVGGALGLGELATTLWNILKWPALAFVVVLIIAILYYATPNAKQPKFRWLSLGAVVAILAIVIATLLFGLYVTNFSNYDRTYGSMAGVVIFLLWLWIVNIALLFGAEFDAELERGRQLQAGIEAEETIQLPPRDTRKIDKAEAKESKDIEEGRRIRRASTHEPDRRQGG
ncbi:MAG TPA: YihY/virulence factor BrkB family protein [Microbacterium sp.]|uniref:YihY/virulence factor BrkB family protein n=1 Tax=Microbacterium sp. TaxID=51671 RepID=UPI002C67164D|nr:YihY/virulence factor BrkB family protein [Microbacterium sp.]HWI31032.1 YihY/virulence factor BrkB family protein [Microbacterium sp.]